MNNNSEDLIYNLEMEIYLLNKKLDDEYYTLSRKEKADIKYHLYLATKNVNALRRERLCLCQ